MDTNLESDDDPEGAAGGGGRRRIPRERAGPAEWSGAGQRMTEPQLSSGKDQRRVQTCSKL